MRLFVRCLSLVFSIYFVAAFGLQNSVLKGQEPTTKRPSQTTEFGFEHQTNAQGEVCSIYYYGPLNPSPDPVGVDSYSQLGWEKTTSLVELEIKHCEVTRALLEYVAQSQSIRSLTIGTEPDEIAFGENSLGALSKMENLQRLFLVDQEFTSEDLSFLDGLPRLEYFYYHHGSLDDVTLSLLLKKENLAYISCESIGELRPETIELLRTNQTLTTLKFGMSAQQDQILEALTEIETLEDVSIATDWSSCSPESLRLLARLPQLRQLQINILREGNVGSILSLLPEIPSLEFLEVNSQATERDLTFLNKFPSIRRMRATQLVLEDKSISELPPSLEELYLNAVNVEESDLPALDQLDQFSFKNKHKRDQQARTSTRGWNREKED